MAPIKCDAVCVLNRWIHIYKCVCVYKCKCTSEPESAQLLEHRNVLIEREKNSFKFKLQNSLETICELKVGFVPGLKFHWIRMFLINLVLEILNCNEEKSVDRSGKLNWKLGHLKIYENETKERKKQQQQKMLFVRWTQFKWNMTAPPLPPPYVYIVHIARSDFFREL